MSQSKPSIDTNYSLETPENVELHAELAGVVVRSLAFSIDFSIRAGALLVIFIISLIIGGLAMQGIILIAFFLIDWFYPVFFEVFKQGQTPGKKAMGIRVVNENLTPIKFGPSLIRNLMRWADFLPSAYAFGLISMAAHPLFQRLGDIAAGTVVIYAEHSTYQDAPADTKPQPSSIELGEQEQKAIVNFTLRKENLSESRQQELASILSDAYSENTPQSTVEKLRSIGSWLLGAR